MEFIQINRSRQLEFYKIFFKNKIGFFFKYRMFTITLNSSYKVQIKIESSKYQFE